MIDIAHVVVIQLRVLPRDVGQFPKGFQRSGTIPVNESDWTPAKGQDVPRTEITVTNH